MYKKTIDSIFYKFIFLEKYLSNMSKKIEPTPFVLFIPLSNLNHSLAIRSLAL